MVALNKKITCKVIFRSFNYRALESYVLSLKQLLSQIGIQASTGSVRLPSEIKRWTVLRSPHIDKKSREQFEWIIHKRYLEVRQASPSLQRIFLHYLQEQIPLGVGVEVKKYEYLKIPSKLSALSKK